MSVNISDLKEAIKRIVNDMSEEDAFELLEKLEPEHWMLDQIRIDEESELRAQETFYRNTRGV